MSDIAINVTSKVPVGNPIANKPSYLIFLEEKSGKNNRKFLTIDKPDLLNGFVLAKGFYCNNDEEEIINKFQVILTDIKKELIIEVMLPWHKISSMRSLIFKAK